MQVVIGNICNYKYFLNEYIYNCFSAHASGWKVSGLLTEDGGDEAARASVVAEFAEVNPLPGAEVEMTVRYG